MTTVRLRGFTLLEVMVALAVIAIGSVGVLRLSGRLSENTADLEQRTLAHWLGTNLLHEYRLEGTWPQQGQTGMLRFAGRDWRWSASESGDGTGLRLIHVDIIATDGARYRVLGYAPTSP